MVYEPPHISLTYNMEENIEFLLRYAKKGVLVTMKDLDPIESEELKQRYISIKRELTSTPQNASQSIKKGAEKPSAVKKWFSGIGDRQKKYQDAHKDDII